MRAELTPLPRINGDVTPQIGTWSRLNAVRLMTVVLIAIGYASTMARGPGHAEIFSHLGYEPSWIGVQVLFFISGILALRSVENGRHGARYLRSRLWGTAPVLIASTLVFVIIAYPLCSPTMQWNIATLKSLTEYSVLTMSGIDPGRPLPGLLDGAPYANLVQGSLWTLRWGLVFHLAVALASHVRALRRFAFTPALLLCAALSTTLAYIGLTYYAVQHQWTEMITIITPLRLSYAFLLGMTLWAYRHKLPREAGRKVLILLLLLNAALITYSFGPWSPVIEVALCSAWGYGAWMMISGRTPALAWLSAWPPLAAGLYIINWPVAQFVRLAQPDISAGALIAISVPLSTAISALLYWTFYARGSTVWLRRKVAVKAPSA